MAQKLKSDSVLTLAAMLLVAVSLVMVWSASAAPAMARGVSSFVLLLRHAGFVAVGLLLMFGMHNVDYRRLRHPVVVWGGVGLVAALLVGVLFSAPVNGASRWFSLAGFGVQPSEFAKLVAVVFVAATIDTCWSAQRVGAGILRVVLVVLPLSLLVFREPDLGTAASLWLIAFAVLFAAGLSWFWVAGMVVLFGLAASAAVVFEPYRLRRFLVYQDPWSDSLGTGFQLAQSLIAVGTGGLLGRGLNGGVQKLFYLPEPQSDFIYAVISEELGLVGATLVVLLFAVFAWRGLRIAVRVPDRFGALLAIGVTAMVAAQALVNISVVTGLVPTKGIPLPLISAGGSSMLVNLLAVGVLLSVSQHVEPER